MTMERRDFIRTGLLAIVTLYGFPENVICSQGKKLLAAGHAGVGSYPFNGIYSITLDGDCLSIPDAFPRSLYKESLVLVVPEKNTSVLLIPESSNEWELLKIIFDTNEKDGPLYLREHADISEDGKLRLSEKVRNFAGIRTPGVTVVGHGNVIEIIDSGILNSRIV